MTGGLVIALYLFTLAGFLGLGVIRRVPPTLHGALATAIGAAAAIVVVLALPAAGATPEPWPAGLNLAALALATAAVVGGLLHTRRLLRDKRDKAGPR